MSVSFDGFSGTYFWRKLLPVGFQTGVLNTSGWGSGIKGLESILYFVYPRGGFHGGLADSKGISCVV